MKATLDNGLQVLLYPNRAAKVVAFQAWVNIGSADETPEVAGIAHVFEHMLFKGTARRKVGQIAQEVEGAGGEINAWTSFDQTVYHLVLASRFFDTGLDILADAIQHSSFDPAELERELKVVLEEIKQGEDNPSRVITQELFKTAFTKHPYRRPVIGFEKVVRTFTRAKLVDFFQRWYVPNNMTFVVVGDFDEREALAKVKKAFGRARSRPIARPSRSEPPQKAARMVVVAQDVREAHMTFAFHIPGLLHEDTPALDVAAILIGQGDSSRLNLTVKRNRQLVTDVYAYTYTPRDLGLFVLGATLPPRGLEDAASAMLWEVARLANEDVTPEELSKARTVIESDAIYQKETVQGLARKLGFFETVAGGIEFEDRYNERVARVTPSSIREVVHRYLTPSSMTGALLVPEPDKAKSVKRAQTLKASMLEVVADVQTRADRHWSRTTRSASSDIVRERLPSGARVLIKRDDSVPVVALRAVWNGGLRYEDARSNGINNMLASLMTRGTKTRSAEAIMHEVEGMAGSIGGFSGRNSFGVREEMLSRHWERGLEIMADCIANPSFAEAELEKERRQVLDELHAQEDNLTSVAFRIFNEELYRKHPYRLDVLGSVRSLATLSHRKLLEYYRRCYPPDQMTLSVVGDIDPDRLLEKLRVLFPASPRDREAEGMPLVPTEPARKPSDSPPEVVKQLNKQQAHLIIGFPGTTVSSPDRFPLEVLSTVLSGQGGRLFVELRDKQALAYRVSAFSLEGLDPGYFAVYIACSPENLGAARVGIQRELTNMRDELVPSDELERSKRYLVGAHEISLQRRSALASTLAFHECYGLGWDEYRRYAPAILSVTSEEVRRVARHYLDPRKSLIALVRPESVAQAVSGRRRAAAAHRRSPANTR